MQGLMSYAEACVDLDDTVVVGLGVECILCVASRLQSRYMAHHTCGNVQASFICSADCSAIRLGLG